jgi:hypothetical protein
VSIETPNHHCCLTCRSMESLNQNDIQLLCNYFREHLPDFERQSRALDFEVVERLANWLLAQGMKAEDIVQKRTRLTKLICHYVDTNSLAKDGKVLPKSVSVDNNEYRKRASSQSPTGSGSGMNGRLPSHTSSPTQQGSIPIYHALQSQQPCLAADKCTNTAKRRRVSGNEGLQTLAVLPISMLESNGSTAQAEDQRCSIDTPNHSEQQHNSSLPLEEAGSIEHRSVSSTSHVASNGGLVPISEEVEEIQERNMTQFGLYRDEPVVNQRLLASRSGPRQSILDNADAQQPLLIDDDLPLLPNSNTDTSFTSYAIEFVHTLDDDARIAFGLHDSLQ